MEKSTLFIVVLLVAGGSAGLLDGIGGIVGGIVGGLVNVLSNALTSITNVVGNMLASINTIAKSLLNTSLGPLIQSLQGALSAIQPALKALLSTVSALPATAASIVNDVIPQLVKTSEDALSTINGVLVPLLTELESQVQSVGVSIENITQILNDSLSKSNCTGPALGNITASINNLTNAADAILNECLAPAQEDVISKIELIVQDIVHVITNASKQILACSINPICLSKVVAVISNDVALIIVSVEKIVFSIPAVVQATGVCLAKEITETIGKNVQDISSNILNCVVN